MDFEKFIEKYIEKRLLKKQKIDLKAIEKLVLRSMKDLDAAKANLSIDEGVAYTLAYLAMLRAGRAYMLLRGFRPADGYQHKTVVEFMGEYLGREFKQIVAKFDRMRRKRNIFTYEIDVIISKKEADGALDVAASFLKIIKERLKKEDKQTKFNF